MLTLEVYMVARIVTNVSVNTRVFVAFSPMVIHAMAVVVRRIRNGRVLCVTIVMLKIKTNHSTGALGRVLTRRRINISAPSVIPSALLVALRRTTCVVRFHPAAASVMRVMPMVPVPLTDTVIVTKVGLILLAANNARCHVRTQAFFVVKTVSVNLWAVCYNVSVSLDIMVKIVI